MKIWGNDLSFLSNWFLNEIMEIIIRHPFENSPHHLTSIYKENNWEIMQNVFHIADLSNLQILDENYFSHSQICWTI